MDQLRVHAVLTANDDGSQAAGVTPQQIRQALMLANDIYKVANVVFAFDPATDWERRSNTLLNHDSTVAPGTDLNTPNTEEPPAEFASHGDARNNLADQYPGRIVVYFSSGDRLRFDDHLNSWIFAPRTYSWSNGTDSYVAMTPGDPGYGIAHEIGHYLHLGHTFGATPEHIAGKDGAADIIRQYIENQGHPKSEGTLVFDGDRDNSDANTVKDTPPDPGPGVFVDAGLDPCKADQGTLTIPVTFSDGTKQTYTVQPDRENIMNYWDKTCRGFPPRLSAGQAARVRNSALGGNRQHLIAEKVLHDGVWEKGASARPQTRAFGWAFNDFVTRFDKELSTGKHAVHVQAYDIGNAQIRWDGVWEPATVGQQQTRAFGWALNDFANRFNAEIAAGKRAVHVQAYNIGSGQIRWDGIWEPAAVGQAQTRALCWALNDFAARFNQEIAAGKRAVHMQAYDIGNGQVRWDGVWELTASGQSQTRALCWAFNDFVKRFDNELAAGRKVVHMQAYDIGGGQIRWDGVWETSTAGQKQTRAFGWAFNDFVKRFDDELAAGRRVVHMQAYDIGGGQIRWDAVWEPSPSGTKTARALSLTQQEFAARFNANAQDGWHLTQTRTYRGR